MTNFSETISRNLTGWVLPVVLSMSGFALIAQILMISSSVTAIDAVMVIAGAVLVFVAMLLLPTGVNVRESASGQILSMDRRDDERSLDTTVESTRRAA